MFASMERTSAIFTAVSGEGKGSLRLGAPPSGSRSIPMTGWAPVQRSSAPRCRTVDWHTWLGETTMADAIMDRIVHGSYKIALKGKSLRDEDEGVTQ